MTINSDLIAGRDVEQTGSSRSYASRLGITSKSNKTTVILEYLNDKCDGPIPATHTMLGHYMHMLLHDKEFAQVVKELGYAHLAQLEYDHRYSQALVIQNKKTANADRIAKRQQRNKEKREAVIAKRKAVERQKYQEDIEGTENNDPIDLAIQEAWRVTQLNGGTKIGHGWIAKIAMEHETTEGNVKKRISKGSYKHTAQDISYTAIMQAIDEGSSIGDIAKDYGVARSVILSII